MLRKQKVVGKFVEFFGEGARRAFRHRPSHNREHGSRNTARRWASLAVDEETLAYLRGTGRSDETLRRPFERYYKAQGLWGIPRKGDVDYTVELELDLGIDRAGCGRSKATPGSYQSS